jgi:hypothetical protein
VNAKILAIWFAMAVPTIVIIRLVRNCALGRMIQCAVTLVVDKHGRSVLDAPPSRGA